MKKTSKKREPAAPGNFKKATLAFSVLAVAGAVAMFFHSDQSSSPSALPNAAKVISEPPAPSAADSEVRYVSRPKGTVTFTRDIAPITLRQCAYCHHQGREAPFNLVTYRDVSK